MSMLKQKNRNIQVLRGLACIMVFLSHFFGTFPNGMVFVGIDWNSSPLRLLWGGNAAVIVFFVLSGFFFYKQKPFSIAVWLEEIVNRHIRLYGVLFVALIIGVVARMTCPTFNTTSISNWIGGFWTDDFSLSQYLMHFFPVLPFDSHLIDPPLWTLRIELRMIFILPVLRYLIDKIPRWVVLLTSLVIGYVVSAFIYLPVFVIGMLARQWLLQHSDINVSIKNGLWFIVAGILLLDAEYIFNFIAVDIPEYFLINLTAIGAVLICVVAYISDPLPRITVPFEIMGDISYMFYVFHFLFLLWFRFLVEKYGFVIYGIVCFTSTVLLSIFIYRVDSIIHKKIIFKSNSFFQAISKR